MTSKQIKESQKSHRNRDSTSSTKSHKDTLFASPIGEIQGFSFNQQVVDVFPDMLKRSIPGYQTIIAQTGLLGARFAQPSTRCYDLGCSLGATALALRSQIPPNCHLIAVDNSSAMLDQLKASLDLVHDADDLCTLELRCEDVVNSEISNASVVALNFTLQFIDIEHRPALLRKICDGMIEGSVLILSEKVIMEDPKLNHLYIDMYHNFKRTQGYSDLEISQKRTALENVLVPDSLETHQQRLLASGFRYSSVWFQCFNFLSLIAVK